MTTLGPGAEFDRIREVWRRLGDRLTAAGDDCALVTVDGAALAISTDLSVEERHFRRRWLTAEEIGWRAAAGALSDLAAVAAEPVGVMASVGAPAADAVSLLPALMEGVGEAAEGAGARVWGGDVIESDRIVLDIVSVGRAPAPVRRSGAVAGAGLWVTGALGAPAAAVRAWMAGGTPGAAARERFAHPVPRVREAWWLREHGATALIDLSDGLVGDAGHVAAASGVACVLDADRVPRHEGADGWEDAVSGGEEYELLAALPADFADAAAFEAAFGLPLTRVGRCERGAGVRVERGGREVEVPAAFSHF